MAIAERKAREFAQRGNLILAEAKTLFSRYGFEAVTMDQIAEAVEYSKGVLYKHFESKEALYIAMCWQEMNRLADLFAAAAQGSGTARDRLIRIGEVYVQECQRDPNWVMGRFQFGQPISVEHKTNEVNGAGTAAAIRNRCFEQDDRALQVVESIIREGQAAGEFRADFDPQRLALIMWADTLGFFVLMASKHLEMTGRDVDIAAAMRKSWDFILDGVSVGQS